MIVSSAPLRISFNGGGSDLDSFTNRSVGRVVSASLDKNVYVAINPSFGDSYRITYSRSEIVSSISEIQHPLVRNVLLEMNWEGPPLEITSMADVPSLGTGLGSSSAFTVALIRGIAHLQGKHYSAETTAITACKVEIDYSKEVVGRQDQFASSFGGFNFFQFQANGNVKTRSLLNEDSVSIPSLISVLNSHMLTFHLNRPRQTSQILAAQQNTILVSDEAYAATKQLACLAEDTFKAILNSDVELIGKLMYEGWKIKSLLNGDMKDPLIIEIMTRLDSTSAYGGKLLGAGGGGFLVIFANPSSHNEIKETFGSLMPLYEMSISIQEPKLIDMRGKI